MTNANQDLRQGVIVGGNGGMGRLLRRHLAATSELVVVDCANGDLIGDIQGVRFLQGDIRTPTAAIREAIRRADLVVLTVPELVALEALPVVLPLISQKSLLVDTLSVKTKFAKAVIEARTLIEALSLNTMFAPSLGFAGQSVIAVELAGGPKSRRFVELIQGWGANVTFLTAAQHDAATVALQATTHGAVLAFGRALRRLGVDVETLLAIAPPPHRTLLALLARIATGPREVYWDIQVSNPNAGEGRRALQESTQWLAAASAGGDPEGFFAELEALNDFLGASIGELATTCTSISEVLRRSGDS